MMNTISKLFCVYCALMLTACETAPPKDAFKLSTTALQERQMQTRKFHTTDEVKLLAAGAGVLQDLGFAIDETEKEAGLITASKTVDARESSQLALNILLIILGGQPAPMDKEQKIKVSLVTTPSRSEKNVFLVRITFQRIVWNTENRITKAESVKDEDIYRGFFEKLSKSVFLEAHNI